MITIKFLSDKIENDTFCHASGRYNLPTIFSQRLLIHVL